MVVPEKPILCDGLVTEWHFWGSRSVIFRAIIWRRVLGEVRKYEVVGTNDIPAGYNANEKVVYSVPLEQRIRVLKGKVPLL